MDDIPEYKPVVTDIEHNDPGGLSYTAAIDGERWSGITEGSRFWLYVLDAIESGAPVTDGTPSITLDEAKTAKKAAIDANTNRIRDRDGLTHAGERFAMNDGAMLKWTGLMSAKDILPYPMVILTIDDKPFVIADQAALMQFLVAVLGYETHPDSPLSTGRALRQRVEAAQTVDDVEAVADDRE